MAANTAGSAGTEISGKVATVTKWLAIIAIPASLFSPGATIAMALVATYGTVIWFKGERMAPDLVATGRFMIACYLVLLALDVLNGGGLENFASTGINYLHLVAVAPFALALRNIGLEYRVFDRAMQVTIAIATIAALTQFFVFSIMRPGGLFLNSIPYGFVLALWGAILLSRGLQQGRDGAASIVFSLMAFIPVLVTESKISGACMLLGYALIVAIWAVAGGRWKTIAAIVVAAVPLLFLAFNVIAYRRIELFLAEISAFMDKGTLSASSFGWRYEAATSGIRAFWEHPFVGYGLNQRMDAILAHTSARGPDVAFLSHPHNDYVTHLVSFGALGLVFVLAFLGFVWWAAWRCADVAYGRAGIALVFMLALYMAAEVAFNMDAISGAVTIVFGLLLLRPQDPISVKA